MMLLVAIFKSTAKLKEKQILHSPLIKDTARAAMCCVRAPIRVSRREHCMAAVEGAGKTATPRSCLSKLWQAFCIVIKAYHS